MDEVWRTIPNCNDVYEISNTGKVRSLFYGKCRILKCSDNGLGYKKIMLRMNNGKHRYYIHRLVAMAFIQNPENKPCVNHIDNNPENKSSENLEWCTKKENTDWMIIQGRFKRTPEWIERLHKAQEPIYKAVIGTNIETGEKLYFNRMNGVKEAGFCPGSVCACCKGRAKEYKGYRWEYAQKN